MRARAEEPRQHRLRALLAAIPKNTLLAPEAVSDTLRGLVRTADEVQVLRQLLAGHARLVRPLSVTPLPGVETLIARACPPSAASRELKAYVTATLAAVRERLRHDGVPDVPVFTHIDLAPRAKGQPWRARVSLRFRRRRTGATLEHTARAFAFDDLGALLVRTWVDLPTDYTAVDFFYRPPAATNDAFQPCPGCVAPRPKIALPATLPFAPTFQRVLADVIRRQYPDVGAGCEAFRYDEAYDRAEFESQLVAAVRDTLALLLPAEAASAQDDDALQLRLAHLAGVRWDGPDEAADDAGDVAIDPGWHRH
jgi:hypothetical protein